MATDDRRSRFGWSRPPLYFSVLLVASLIGAAHELAVRQPEAYLSPGFGPPLWGATAGALIGALIGALAAVESRSDPRQLLPRLLLALSLLTTLSAPALFFAFARGRVFAPLSHALPPLGAALSAAALVSGFRALGPTLAALGALSELMNPFRLFGLAVTFGVAAAAAAQIGLLRSAAFVGLVLGLLSLWSWTLFGWLDGRRPIGARAGRALGAFSMAVAAGSIVLAERLVPLDELAFHEGEIVYAKDGEYRRYVVSSMQRAFALFSDHTLRVSTLDEARYHEALVHPALAARPDALSALVLGAGHGLVERELLKSARLERIDVVVADRALHDMARRMTWLAQLSGHALESPRIHVVESEPMAFLEQPGPEYDLVVADLDDPTGPVEGKNYTVYFDSLLARRLTERGVATMQATSVFATPRTFANLVGTAKAAGLDVLAYRAPVPLIGEWGFLLLSRQPIAPPVQGVPGAHFMSDPALAAAFELPADVSAPASEPSRLHAQHAVSLLALERSPSAP